MHINDGKKHIKYFGFSKVKNQRCITMCHLKLSKIYTRGELETYKSCAAKPHSVFYYPGRLVAQSHFK